MIQFTEHGNDIFVPKDKVSMILINELDGIARIKTEKTEHIVSIEKAREIIEELKSNEVAHLSSAIRNLTNLLRARLH